MVEKELYAQLKEHCNVNGLKVKFVINKIIREYLEKK